MLKKSAKNSFQDNGEISYEIKTLITVLLLIFAYPAGAILMFIWNIWPTWLKVLILVPIIFFLFFMFGILAFITSNATRMNNYNYSQSQNLITPSPLGNSQLNR